MITIKYDDNSIKISGHSNADVCAAVSSITYTGVNFLTEYKLDSIEFTDTVDENYEGEMNIKLLIQDDITKKIFDTMIKMYQDVVDQVPSSCIEIKKML